MRSTAIGGIVTSRAVRKYYPVGFFFCDITLPHHSDDKFISKLHLVIAAHLRRFNQNPEWDVRQVLPIRGFLMSAQHLHHSDKVCGLLLIYVGALLITAHLSNCIRHRKKFIAIQYAIIILVKYANKMV